MGSEIAKCRIVPFSRQFNRSTFNSGDDTLDRWLKQYSGQNQHKDLTRTFLALDPAGESVIGYYAAVASIVEPERRKTRESAPTNEYSIPVILLARLAVDRGHHGRGIGSALLAHALTNASLVAEKVGVQAVIVDAASADAKAFYLAHGFVAFPDFPTRLVLPISTIQRLADGTSYS
jgi:GNAT superfamily N-acetyltransferase